jgi:hypothetical protein
MSLLDTASLVVTPNGTKAGKLYSVVPSSGAGDLDVTRATTATRVNSSGLIESVASNVPRLDYTNGTCPSILVEPQRTNLLLYSEQFDNASYWSPYDAIITANTTVAPDGTTTAETLTSNASTGGSVYRLIAPVGTYTLSVFYKAGTTDKCGISFSANGSASFDLTNETFVESNGGIAKIEKFANGWYKCSVTVTTATTTLVAFGTDETTGKSVHIWGAQLEAGSYATSYIPTTSASVTRNADVISKTGISSLIGQTEGTLFVDELFDDNATNNGGLDDTLISLSDGTANNLISIFHYGRSLGSSDRKVLFFIRLSNTTQVAIFSSTLTSGRYKIALAYKNNDVVAYINGTQIGTDTSASIPTTSVVTLVDPISTNAATKTVNFNLASIWKTRLTNSQLQTLTTI